MALGPLEDILLVEATLADPAPITVQRLPAAPPCAGFTDSVPDQCRSELQDTSTTYESPPRQHDHSRDSRPLHAAVGPDESACPALPHAVSELPLVTMSNGEATTFSGDNVAPVNENPKRIPVRFRSGNPVDRFRNNRYEKRHHLSSEPDWKAREIRTIPAMNKFSPRASTVGRGWVPYVHPEGQLYFRFKQYYTNSYLYDEDTLQDLEEAVDVLDQELQKHDDLPENYDVVLETYVDDDNDKLACYYIADTVNEEVMWLDDQSIDLLVRDEDLPILTHQHLKHAHLRCYWQHIYMFPHGRHCSAQQLRDLRVMIRFHLFDRVTSSTSCAPWNEEVLSALPQILKDIDLDGDTVSPWDMSIVARLRMRIATVLMRDYSGTKWARLESNRSARMDVTAEAYAPSWIFTVVSWVLFCTPALYWARLEETYLDGMSNSPARRNLIREAQEDWMASITPTAVILSANVGFLAIQSVDQSSLVASSRSVGQVISYMSTLLSIGNIIACTILSRQHRSASTFRDGDMMGYLWRRVRTRGQTQRLAVILSIPTAFFIWALLLFSAAILWLCYNATSTATRAPVVAILLFTACLLGLGAGNDIWKLLKIPRLSTNNARRILRKIPVQRLIYQMRGLSQRWADKVRNYTSRMSTNPGDEPDGPSTRAPSAPSRRPFERLLQLTHRLYGLRRTSESVEMTPV